MAVWIVDAPPNRAAAQRLWAQHSSDSHLDGVTTFKAREGASAEEMLLDKLDTIDLYSGQYSRQSPYTALEVIGAAITERIKAAMSVLGFAEFQSTASGFRAVRPVANE